MHYTILRNEASEQESLGLRLRRSQDGITYLDVVISNGGTVAILWLNIEGELHIDKTNTDNVGLKYIGE